MESCPIIFDCTTNKRMEDNRSLSTFIFCGKHQIYSSWNISFLVFIYFFRFAVVIKDKYLIEKAWYISPSKILNMFKHRDTLAMPSIGRYIE